jgi:hypothetical protein
MLFVELPVLRFTQEALQTGIGPTRNTITDTIDCIHSQKIHNILSSLYFNIHFRNYKQPNISHNVLKI